MAKYCGYCGAKMPDNAKVCGACGKPLSRKPQSPAEQNAAASLHSPCETAAENPKKGFPQKRDITSARHGKSGTSGKASAFFFCWPWLRGLPHLFLPIRVWRIFRSRGSCSQYPALRQNPFLQPKRCGNAMCLTRKTLFMRIKKRRTAM